MAEHGETLGWIPPRGGVTAFPWLLSGENSRPFCQAAADQGILLAPGDCWDAPSHFRLGFAATPDKFPDALKRLAEIRQQLVSRERDKRVAKTCTRKISNGGTVSTDCSQPRLQVLSS